MQNHMNPKEVAKKILIKMTRIKLKKWTPKKMIKLTNPSIE